MSVAFLSLADGGLAYQRQTGDGSRPGVVFLGGFGSDMTGAKAGFLSQRCAENATAFARFDYRGCGRSPGAFTDGTIGLWLEDALAVIDHLTEGPQILIGSSMGGWIGLLAAQARPARIAALIGIAAAPDFTEELIWEKLTISQRQTLLRDGVIYDDRAPPDHRLPMTLKLIEDGRRHLALRSPLTIDCPIHLLHGMRDDEVPPSYAQRIADHVTQEDVRVTLVKDGDHRLNRPQDLDLMWRIVERELIPAPA